MNLYFKNQNIAKEYKVIIEEKINNEIRENKVNVSFEFMKDKVNFFILTDLEEKNGELEKILEKTNEIFKEISYELDKAWQVIRVRNSNEIIKKWDALRKDTFFYLKKESLKDFVFELSRIINNKSKLEEMLKRFNVIPYVFLGIYNQEIKKSSPLRLEKILYNLFPLANIPVQYEIYDDSSKEEKQIKFLIKESSKFDRQEYIKKVLSYISENQRIGSFDLNGSGIYIFDEDDLLKKMEKTINIEIKNLLTYTCNYQIEEIKKDNDTI
ncbi:hypothetical protein [Fusobacterium sp.]|uniref:hypothetical protein n=1 Tax=Fusobacterium sp. TaxID=68766 RepID=UPI0028FEC194|nr:hypothetical protein [Fusobacterium sp.]MDU1911575.1 hypothetical protein [Fusobacterium sp.]